MSYRSSTNMNKYRPELVAPAGDTEKLRFAYIYGADAAYVGCGAFSLRNGASMELDQLREARAIADEYDRRLYAALNIYANDADLPDLRRYIKALADIAPDALIVSDPGVLLLAQEIAPELPLHISTQANVGNHLAARFWHAQGARRIILSRELSLEAAAQLDQQTDIETEVFVHGALCMAYSGRCLLSSFMTGRSANRGDCSQPCRWRYALMEEQRPGEYFPIEEDARGSYIMNSRDLCRLGQLPQLMAGGFSAWKIEGRNKSAYYVANTVRIYRAAIDAYMDDPEHYSLREEWLRELASLSHREYCEGVNVGVADASSFRYEDGGYIRSHDFTAILWEMQDDTLIMEQRNHIAPLDELEILLPEGDNISFLVRELYDELGAPLAAANHPRQMLRLKGELSHGPERLRGPLICRRLSRS